MGYKYRVQTQMQAFIRDNLTNLPKLSLAELLNKATRNNKMKSARKVQPVRCSRNKQNDGMIDVRQPFYIDRFQHFKHTECHLQGKCLGCLYGRLREFEMKEKQKKEYLHSDRSRITKLKFDRIKTQRVSEDHSENYSKHFRRFRSSEGSDKTDLDLFFLGLVKMKMKKFSEEDKAKFNALLGWNCQDEGFLSLCVTFLKNSYEKGRKGNIDSKASLCNYLSQYDFKKLFQEKIFLKYLKNETEKMRRTQNNKSIQNLQLLNNKSVNQLLKRKKPNDLCSIKLISHEDPHPNKEKKLKIKVAKKKVKIVETESDIAGQNTETRLICSNYLINDDSQFNQEVKQKLEMLAKKKYKRFRGAVEMIDDFICEQVGQNPNIHGSVTRKLGIATDWMKMCIPNSDKYEDLKHNQLDKLYNSVQNFNKQKKRKSNLKQLGAGHQKYGNSQFGQEEEIQRRKRQQGLRRKSTAKSNRSKSSLKKEGLNTQSDQDLSQFATGQIAKELMLSEKLILLGTDSRNNRKKGNKMEESTEKLIQDESCDHVAEHESLAPGKKKSQKKSDLKHSFLKHEKFQEFEIEEEVKPDEEEKETKVEKKTGKNQTAGEGKKKRERVERKQELLAKSYQAENEHRKRMEEQIEEEKEKKRRVFLKMRAAELLKQNQELIANAEKHLKTLDLSKFIIKSSDCVFTQKKKIRHLREIIRLRSESKSLEQKTIEQILEYLSIYEENYHILMEKCPGVKVSTDYENEFNFANVVGKRQIYNQLLFYDLQGDLDGKKGEEEFFNFSFGAVRDKSWEISTKNISGPILINIPVEVKKKKEEKVVLSDLIQMQMSQVVHPQTYGIFKLKEILSSPGQSQQKFLMTQNA